MIGSVGKGLDCCTSATLLIMSETLMARSWGPILLCQFSSHSASTLWSLRIRNCNEFMLLTWQQEYTERPLQRRISCIQDCLKRFSIFQEYLAPNKSGSLRHQLFYAGTLWHFTDTALIIFYIMQWNSWLQTLPNISCRYMYMYVYVCVCIYMYQIYT